MFDHGHKGGFTMRAFSGASFATAAMLALSMSVGCSQVGQVQAKRDFKAANAAYQAQDYKKAADLYEETLKADPNLAQAYFFLGNSYDNLYKPSRKGEAANDDLLNKAVENYQLCAEKLSQSPNEEDKKLAKLALEYLVAAYGTDKLNDPAKAEPVLIKMIEMEPTEPSNYAVLAKIYEDAGLYDEAEKVLNMSKAAKPKDASVYMQLAGFYNRQGRFDKTIEALNERAQIEPNNPEAFQTIAGYYWDETRGDSALTDAQKKDYIQKGLEAVDKALSLKPDYVEAITFKGLLLRLQANVEKDPSKQQALLKEATELSDKANELRKQKTSGN
jgi:tetratricopeptide (TPR) repeat protein